MATHILNFPNADIHTTKIKSSSGEFTSDGNLSLLTSGGGTTNLTATGGGNIGIGTLTPSFKLDVNGDLNFAGTLYQGGVAYAGSPWTTTGSDIYYTTGNIGIGVSSPSKKLHVSDNLDGNMMIEGTGLNYSSYLDLKNTQRSQAVSATGGWYRIRSYGTSARNGDLAIEQMSIDGTSVQGERLTINNGGNVGIGTDSPLGKLDVRGAIIAPVIAYASNQDAPYLVAGTPGYNGDPGNTGNWNLHGFQHRIKSDSGGTPRITVDTASSGEVFTIRNNGNVGIGTTNPSAPLHVAGGTIINSDGVAKKTYSYSGDLTSGQTVANSTIKITFSAHVFYAKIVAHLVESDNEVSTFSLECGGGNWSGGTPIAIAKGPQAIFGSASTNPWSSTVTTSATTVSFKPTTNMAVAGHYNVFIEYISQSSSGVVSKITEGTTDVVTFGY